MNKTSLVFIQRRNRNEPPPNRAPRYCAQGVGIGGETPIMRRSVAEGRSPQAIPIEASINPD